MTPVAATARPHLAAPSRSDRVPVEFVGLARQLRNKIVKAHPKTVAAIEQLIVPLRPRPDFALLYGRSMLRLAAGRWRGLPPLGRLRQVTQHEAGRLQLTELRLVPSRIEATGWSEDEQALAIALHTVRVDPPTFKEKNTMIIGIGLHAIARRFERGVGRSDAVVLRDLLPIAIGYPALARACEFSVPVPGGGRWIGAVAAGSATAIVRTFVA